MFLTSSYIIGDMEFTMVHKSACKGRLEASLHDNQYTNPATQKLAEILEPKDVFAFMHNPETMTGQQIAKALADGTVLSKDHYAILLKYLNNSGREYKSAYTNSRYPLGTLILPTMAQNHTQIPFNNSTYSCYKSHEGQSHIQFYIPGGYGGAWETGYIETIWELPLEGVKHTFLLVRKHQPLSPAQNSKSPYYHHPCSLLNAKLVRDTPSDHIYILEPRHIITHLTVYKRPKGTYGINSSDMLAICWALNRGRR